ncbi:hypothetical protein A9K55_003582 [Cordyceps militaris]|uniref:Uncharacterized protein n=1 Tax=Cordyceps militaris TaxID=73501 RepID=A0A2H4S829_CORMI|nr:hypothetical protein A9K55_003582 [Cordyceps militaris]
MRAVFTFTLAAAAATGAAIPVVLDGGYWVGAACKYEGPEQKTICDAAGNDILYCHADGHWHNGYTCPSGRCRIRPPPFHGQAGNAYCSW